VSEVSVSLKLLHNSSKKLLQTNAMLVVKASLTLSFLYQHRRSQGVGAKWAMAPTKFLENIVILCFERRFSKQNSVIRLKPNVFPPRIFGLATPLYINTNMLVVSSRRLLTVLRLTFD